MYIVTKKKCLVISVPKPNTVPGEWDRFYIATYKTLSLIVLNRNFSRQDISIGHALFLISEKHKWAHWIELKRIWKLNLAKRILKSLMFLCLKSLGLHSCVYIYRLYSSTSPSEKLQLLLVPHRSTWHHFSYRLRYTKSHLARLALKMTKILLLKLFIAIDKGEEGLRDWKVWFCLALLKFDWGRNFAGENSARWCKVIRLLRMLLFRGCLVGSD